MRTPSESDRYFARLAAERAEKAKIKPRKPSPAHEQARSTLETAMEHHRDRPNILGGNPDVPHVPTHEEMCDNFRRADREREENYEGYVSEDKPRDLEDVEENQEKGVKRQLRELSNLVSAHVQDHARDTACSDLPQEDGVSDRPVHDPVVPYEDLPGDEVASLAMPSTAPCEVKSGGAVIHDGTYRSPGGAPVPLNEFADTFYPLLDGPYGVSQRKPALQPNTLKARMEAQRSAGANLPTQEDSSQVAPQARHQPDPAAFNRGLVINGHEDTSPGHDGPRSPVSPSESAVSQRGAVGPKFSTPDFNAASVYPPTAATGTDSHGRSARSVNVQGHVSE